MLLLVVVTVCCNDLFLLLPCPPFLSPFRSHSFIFPFVLFMSFLFVLLKARVLDPFLSRVLRIHLRNIPDSVCTKVSVIQGYTLLVYIDNFTFFQSIAYVLFFSRFSFIVHSLYYYCISPLRGQALPRTSACPSRHWFIFFYLTFQLVSFFVSFRAPVAHTHVRYELNSYCQDGVCHLL
jgi:hypothetical protein